MSIEWNPAVSSASAHSRAPSRPAAGKEARSAQVSLILTVEDTIWEELRQREQRLLQDPTDPHITQYLDTVRDLLNHALKRHQAKSQTYWSPKGRFRQMIHIVQVNRALDDLVNDVRRRRGAWQLARHLDLIRGLLLDLWV
ncbi:MAG: DUF327 family protein [Firmicutes bacterium]|nr:DUF327 family protein [Bacillota bacterium]